MLLGRVIGSVVASQKDEGLEGFTLLVVETMTPDGKKASGYVVAVDTVGAGRGEVVLYATGSSARLTRLTDKRPADAAIIAIVDTVEVGGSVTYEK